MSIKIDPWQKGDRLDSTKMNQPGNAVMQHLPIVGGNGISTNLIGNGGTTVAMDTRLPGRAMHITGQIVTAGPNGEADFTDYRYWVQLTTNNLQDATTPTDSKLDLETLDPIDENDDAGLDVIICAINLPEYVSSTHTMAEDTHVAIAPMYIDSPQADTQAAQVRWFVVNGYEPDIGLYENQVRYMTAQNVAGWSYVRSHSIG